MRTQFGKWGQLVESVERSIGPIVATTRNKPQGFWFSLFTKLPSNSHALMVKSINKDAIKLDDPHGPSFVVKKKDALNFLDGIYILNTLYVTSVNPRRIDQTLRKIWALECLSRQHLE